MPPAALLSDFPHFHGIKPLQTISENDFQSLVAGARLLEADKFGPKVLLTPSGRIVKLFRRKSLMSSAALFPYASRFAENARRLAMLDIPSVDVSAVLRIPSQKRDAVVYPLLPGTALRSVLDAASPEERKALLLRLADFCAHLHQLGVHFRSLHLGNVLLTPDQRFALIDIADLRCRRFSLGPLARIRNLGALLRLKSDRDYIEEAGMRLFIDRYLASASMPRKALAVASWLSRSPWRPALT
ncbi:MAG: hypothetical protein RL095_3792 [Verrucomicrobiota bacterium]|jgi:serine/threonine protein kinase